MWNKIYGWGLGVDGRMAEMAQGLRAEVVLKTWRKSNLRKINY